MNLISKYKKGDVVWFFTNMINIRCLEGQILDVAYWSKSDGFSYDIVHYDSNGTYGSFTVREAEIFSSKEEILNTIFEENGIPADTEENTGE